MRLQSTAEASGPVLHLLRQTRVTWRIDANERETEQLVSPEESRFVRPLILNSSPKRFNECKGQIGLLEPHRNFTAPRVNGDWSLLETFHDGIDRRVREFIVQESAFPDLGHSRP